MINKYCVADAEALSPKVSNSRLYLICANTDKGDSASVHPFGNLNGAGACLINQAAIDTVGQLRFKHI